MTGCGWRTTLSVPMTSEATPQHVVGDAVVVHRHRIAGLDLDLDRATVRRSDAVDDALDAVMDALAGGLADGADGALDLGALGNDVVRRARRDASDGDHRWVEHVDGAGDHQLQGLHHLARYGDGIERPMRARWRGRRDR